MDHSIIGGIIIALGLYSVVWGKAKDCSDPKLPSKAAGETKSLPITTIDGSKIDIAMNLENQPTANKKLEVPDKVEKETELHTIVNL